MHAFDRADRDVLGFEHRALLDVQFDEGVRNDPGARVRAGVADAFQLVAQARPVAGDGVERGLDRQSTGVDEAAEHVGREAARLPRR